MNSVTDFTAERKGNGTKEWADINENIVRGCTNNCLYCYAASNAKRFKLRDRDDWAREELTRKAEITRYPKKNGVIMFPTAHDITPFNLEAYVRVARLMLEAGNKVLMVSKPRLECIQRLTEEFVDYKDKTLFRFTIGTTDTAVAKSWEPGAPSPGERVAALKLAFEAGYQTSVSAEPLLGGLKTAKQILDAVRPYVTDKVWIGKMNRIRSRVDMTVPANAALVKDIEQLQAPGEILEMFQVLIHDPLVKWKNSIYEVIDQTKPYPQSA